MASCIGAVVNITVTLRHPDWGAHVAEARGVMPNSRLLGVLSLLLFGGITGCSGSTGGGTSVPPTVRGPVPVPTATPVPLATQEAGGRPPGAITWPAGHALPTFATLAHLDVADISRLPADQQVLFATLQGIVNRKQPRIYLIQNGPEGKTTWLQALRVPTTTHADPFELLTMYRAEITGLIVDDPAITGTINVATTAAGIYSAVVASPTLAALLQRRFHVPVVMDLRGRFKTDLEAYLWAANTLYPETTHRMLVGMDPTGESANLRDYAVANMAFVIWADPANGPEASLLGQVMNQMPIDSPYLGWWPRGGEYLGVALASQHGIYVTAADLTENWSVFSGAPATISTSQKAMAPPPLASKIYITFTFSDGDNAQYIQHRMWPIWNDPNRGSLPMNWTISPLMVDAAPIMLATYQQTATQNDYFVAGPSGAGYTYPSFWPSGTFAAYAQQTGAYLARTGLSVIEVLNGTGRMSQPLPSSLSGQYISNGSPLGLGLHLAGSNSPTIVNGSTPAVNELFVSNTPSAETAIAQASNGWTGSGPLFLSIYVSAFDMSPTDVATIAHTLDSRYSIVRGDQFFDLIREQNGLPF